MHGASRPRTPAPLFSPPLLTPCGRMFQDGTPSLGKSCSVYQLRSQSMLRVPCAYTTAERFCSSGIALGGVYL